MIIDNDKGFIFEVVTNEEYMDYERKIYTNSDFAKKEFINIDIDNIDGVDDGHFEFKRPKEKKRVELINSIRLNGIIEPLILYRHNTSFGHMYYTIISGYERHMALKALYVSTGDKKFETVDAIVYDDSEVSFMMTQNMRMDSNLNRRMDISERIRFIISKCRLLKGLKQKRNDYNVGEEVARLMSISKSTVYSYLELENLIPEFFELLRDHKITLENALKLAIFNQDYQRIIFNELGNEGVKNYIIKKLPKEDVKSVYAMKSMLNFIRLVVKKGPPNARISINCKTAVLEKLSEIISNALMTNGMGEHKVKVLVNDK